MRAKASKQGRTKRVLAGKRKRLRKPQAGRVEFSQEIVLEAPPRKPVSIYAEETEIKDHKEETVA